MNIKINTILIKCLIGLGLFISCKESEAILQITETVTDIDGNTYETVKIGEQIWMKENLKTTQYRNGDPIPKITNPTKWAIEVEGAYCNYNNSDSIANIYGRHYNYYVIDDVRGICPTGWHVPSSDEWDILMEELWGLFRAGGKMKESGTEHWLSPNTGATNSSGFTALPSGGIDQGYSFFLGESSDWWTSTVIDGSDYPVMLKGVHFNSNGLSTKFTIKTGPGNSIRCLKD